MPLSNFFSIPQSVREWNIFSQKTEIFAKPYTVATLPDAAQNRGMLALVTNESGGETIAFAASDGNWRRTQDRAIVT